MEDFDNKKVGNWIKRNWWVIALIVAAGSVVVFITNTWGGG